MCIKPLALSSDSEKFRERETYSPSILGRLWITRPFDGPLCKACGLPSTLPTSLPILRSLVLSPLFHVTRSLQFPRIARFLSELSRWKGLGRRDRGVR